MKMIISLLTGNAEFGESDEYFRFRYCFFMILLIFGAITSTLFIIGDHSELNRLSNFHIMATKIHVFIAFLLLLVLRGRKHLYYPLGYFYAFYCFMLFVSAFFSVPQDELRVLWFFLNITPVYFLLGNAAGLLTGIASVFFLVFFNRYLANPYSLNAIATSIVGFIYITATSHVYASMALSFFSRMRESNEKLRYLAEHDSLTGVINHRSYHGVCDRFISMAKREKSPFAVLFIDLDHFKMVNDRYGHKAGDHVLKEVAACIGKHIRESDIIGRVGGEEFSVFLPNTNLEGARLLAEKLRLAIENLMPCFEGTQIKQTASIGAAASMDEYPSIETIQASADQAMYLSKQNGRNRVSCINELKKKYGLDKQPVEGFAFD